MKVTRELTVTNPHGLHARPAMQVVETAGGFDCDLTLTKAPDPAEGETEPTVADAKSVMQVITLAAVPGTTLTLDADGPDAESAADAIQHLFDSKFGEE